MKKVVLATFLACAVASCLPLAFAQDASSPAQSAPAAAQPAPAADPCAVPPMAAPEYAVYNNAITQSDPKAQAAGLEQYLTQFPQTAVKEDTLQRLVLLYSGFDIAKTLDASDRLLQVDANNPYALFFEALIRKNQTDSITDPAAKQAALDSAAGYAQKGLLAPKPKCLADADYTKLKANSIPTFYSVIGNDAFGKKDSPTAIDNFKKELAAVPLDQTKQPGPPLLDTFYLAEAYVQSTPPDYLSCAFYASRVIAYAPDAFKQQAAVAALPKYCFHKFHGPADDVGFDAVTAAATANLNPPDGFAASVKPAPTPADIVNQVFATTPDLTTLAVDDKEYILQNGTPDQAAKMWNLLKGKSYQIQGTVVSATPTELQLSVSSDAVQSKTADYTIKLAAADAAPEEPKASATAAQKLAYKKAQAAWQKQQDDIAAATKVGSTVGASGTYDSFTPNPIMITMTDGAVVLPKTEKTPAHTTARPVAHKAAAH
jgi:hypothetical protein